MTTRRHIALLTGLAALLSAAPLQAGAQWLEPLPDAGECTIGVAAGRVTADGRPLLWKVRDATEEENEVSFVAGEGWKYVAVVNAGSDIPWMAVNERGFALVNSNSTDLPGPDNSGNGSFMRRAMTACGTVAEFQRLLDSTNAAGRNTQANFGVIDSTGAAAMFETGGSLYWLYNAADSAACPAGYVVRTNFALNGGGTTGRTRYLRSGVIIEDLVRKDSLSTSGLLRRHVRDMADASGRPFPIPFPAQYEGHLPVGFVPTAVSISRSTTVSAAIVEGVSPREPAALTTLWAMLGQPAGAVLLPYWPVGQPPVCADSTDDSPLCQEAQRIESSLFRYVAHPVGGNLVEYMDTRLLSDGRSRGLWHQLLPGEAALFQQARALLHGWRRDPPAPETMLRAEWRLAEEGLELLRMLQPGRPADPDDLPVTAALEQNYPNPFNGTTRIRFSSDASGPVRLILYDLLGREVRTLVQAEFGPGSHEVSVNLSDLASGFYVYRLFLPGPGSVTLARKLAIVR